MRDLGGSFGVVYRALHKPSGEEVAIKHIDLEGSDDDIVDIQQEISLLATCKSDYVTRYRTSFVRGVKLWIVMEYLGGGSCLDLLKSCAHGMEEKYIAVIMKELLHGLDYLHTTGKIHRDIKAANVLLSDTGRVKIADFGVAAQLTNIKSQRLTFVGTPFWMAPEVIQEAGYDFRADIWSLGITAMEMALGEPPRSDLHPMKVLFLIPKEKPPRLEGSRWSKEFKDFVALCLNKEAEQRPSAKALLKHPFIRRAGSTEVLQELVLRARRFGQMGGASEKDVRFYEETLKSMSAVDDEDDWIFETVKTSANMRPPPLASHTIKRRKVERNPSMEISDVENATAALENMTLAAGPLSESVSSSTGTPIKEASPIRTPKPRVASSQRRVSAITARKTSISSPTARRISRNVSGAMGTTRRVSVQRPKQPLGLDMSFGNGSSTIRQFKRVSSDPYSIPPPSDADLVSTSPKDSVFDSDSENKPPPPTAMATNCVPTPAVPATKEAVLGRRCYDKCISRAFEEACAATADRSKRTALSNVAEAWSIFNEQDSEGELLLLRSIMDRIQADPKLASVLFPQRVANAQLASLRNSPTKPGTQISEIGSTSASIMTPSSTPSKRSHVQSSSSPSKRESVGSPVKLVMNPQNPHLKKMQSSQTQQSEREKAALDEKTRLDEKMPGGKAQPGMEHVSALADVLYGRWAEGLRVRWPLA